MMVVFVSFFISLVGFFISLYDWKELFFGCGFFLIDEIIFFFFCVGCRFYIYFRKNIKNGLLCVLKKKIYWNLFWL